MACIQPYYFKPRGDLASTRTYLTLPVNFHWKSTTFHFGIQSKWASLWDGHVTFKFLSELETSDSFFQGNWVEWPFWRHDEMKKTFEAQFSCYRICPNCNVGLWNNLGQISSTCNLRPVPTRHSTELEWWIEGLKQNSLNRAFLHFYITCVLFLEHQ